MMLSERKRLEWLALAADDACEEAHCYEREAQHFVVLVRGGDLKRIAAVLEASKQIGSKLDVDRLFDGVLLGVEYAVSKRRLPQSRRS